VRSSFGLIRATYVVIGSTLAIPPGIHDALSSCTVAHVSIHARAHHFLSLCKGKNSRTFELGLLQKSANLSDSKPGQRRAIRRLREAERKGGHEKVTIAIERVRKNMDDVQKAKSLAESQCFPGSI
jgi:hypothetical protein